IAEGQQAGRVTAGAALPEHLEAALELVLVVGAKDTAEAPALLFDVRSRVAVFLGHGGAGGQGSSEDQGGEDRFSLEHDTGPVPHQPLAWPRTLSEMLVG